MALGSKRTWDEWIEEYEQSHQNIVNRACHALGIPMIVVALVLAGPACFAPALWRAAVPLFILGWLLQFIGHVFEGKPPEFFRDLRFMLVGTRWWLRTYVQRRKI